MLSVVSVTDGKLLLPFLILLVPSLRCSRFGLNVENCFYVFDS